MRHDHDYPARPRRTRPVGGGVGHSRFGYAGWGPAGVLIVILVVMFATGNLRF